MQYPQLLVVGIIAALFASPTEPTYGGPALSKPAITKLHLPELADATINHVMRQHSGRALGVFEDLRSWFLPGKPSRPLESLK
jgi:hypothetical protein